MTAGRILAWLRGGRGGLFVLAAGVGVGAGLSAVVFRYLVYFFTWLATGHTQFGQQGRVGSTHLPWLGLGFLVLIPVIGGLLYGPLIYRFAREARGHGVPEVMMAVADHGGRIRPQVSLVKAVASALCMGAGGSVGREGPIVQIGSALASSLGQWVKIPESRLRILVACGAAGGIAATFNAPITGVFFGVEIILRAFSIDALFTVMLAAMIADVTAVPFLGTKPFLSGFPSGISLHGAQSYLLVAVLAVVAALMGLAFKAVLYKTEDLCDALWHGRPEWARPAVGGIALGVLLLALPQMYGVGYPVMDKATAGQYALWFLVLLAFGKIVACSLTIGIGGSGGVFAPSLFIGVASGMAYGDAVHHLFGAAAGQPALYAVVAMGAVFASATRAPLTSLASVVEMTGDFSLTLPVMLAVAIASSVSQAMSYGTIYTTKLLRRGTDIDRTTPWRPLSDLKVTDVMRPFAGPAGGAARRPRWLRWCARSRAGLGRCRRAGHRAAAAALGGRDRIADPGAGSARGPRPRRAAGAIRRREPGAGLGHRRERAARAQPRDHRRPGRSHPGPARRGLRSAGRPPRGASRPRSCPATGWSRSPSAEIPRPRTPGWARSAGQSGSAPVAVLRGSSYRPADPDLALQPGDRVSLLAPVSKASGSAP